MEQRHACYINNMIFVVSSCCIRSAEWVPVPWGDRKWFGGGHRVLLHLFTDTEATSLTSKRIGTGFIGCQWRSWVRVHPLRPSGIQGTCLWSVPETHGSLYSPHTQSGVGRPLVSS